MYVCIYLSASPSEMFGKEFKLTAFNAQDFTPLGSVFIALSCSFLVLT